MVGPTSAETRKKGSERSVNGERAKRFAARWTAQRGFVFWADPSRPLTEVMREARLALFGDRPEGTVVAWEHEALRGVDWPAAFPHWQYREFRWRQGAAWCGPDRVDAVSVRTTVASADLGITGCAWAVADTGTVALYQEAGAGLWPSLLPPAHLTVLDARRIVDTVPDGLRRLRAEAAERGMPPIVKLVTGPSSTADIEGQLWVGVHGPARVGVIILETESGRGSTPSPQPTSWEEISR
jgi:hypothetical protein